MGRYMLCGYLVNDAWLLKRGLELGCGSDEDPTAIESTLVASGLHILITAGLFGRSTVAGAKYKGDSYRCIVVATRNPHNPKDYRPMPPPEGLVKLKEILMTEREPKWYPYA